MQSVCEEIRSMKKIVVWSRRCKDLERKYRGFRFAISFMMCLLIENMNGNKNENE